MDGNATIVFDEQGAVYSFTLGEAIELGGWSLAAGTSFSAFPCIKISGINPSWSCTLVERMRLPEIELAPDDSAIFDKASKTLTHICLSGERVLDGERLLSGPIRVDPDGRIDRKRARKEGFLRR